MKHYLMTYFGTILTLHDGILQQTDIRNIDCLKECISVKGNKIHQIIIKHNNCSLYPAGGSAPICNDIFQIECLRHDVVALKKGNNYLCCLPEHSASDPSAGLELRLEQKEWETFHLISKKHLKQLILLHKNGFLLNKKHYSFKRNNIDYMTFISHQMDEKIITYEDFFSSFRKDDLSFTFFQDDYPYFAKIYNPCFLYVLFGSGEIQKQFIASLMSLIKIGKYQGHIIVTTDNEPSFIEKTMKELSHENYSINTQKAFDRTDMINMRLDFIGRNSLANNFQPLFYIDCDILITNNINTLLKEAVFCKNPSAQIESFNTLKNSPSTGGTLYQASPFPSEDVCGFNSGILMLPSGSKYQDLFHTAYTMATHHAARYGRDSVPFFDQSILNYVLYKSDNFSAEPVTSATALEPETVTEDTLFIHFWKFAPGKAEEMKKYLYYLLNKSSQP